MLQIIPISLRQANEYVRTHHRHHSVVQGNKFSVGARAAQEMVGVVIVGRPVARMLDDGMTVEVTRLCTNGAANACSFLYAAAAKISREMGYSRIVTYILASESGLSLKAAGWLRSVESSGGTWSRPSRPRKDSHPLEAKVRWEKRLNRRK
ncbi:MAG TPA: XF1762 family protein [Edaphobacter sp.]|nr:XF1762 family protein [Edaphobacter sp.]